MNALVTEAPASTHPAAEAAADAWAVQTAQGQTLYLPPTLHSISTYVVLEQERWFEPEMSLLPHLLHDGANALDIGANHGVYTLEMARCSGHGRVWSFEPTSAPRGRLLRSVQANGLQDRVTVVAAALADSDGEASFAVSDNSELNSREGAGARRETVRQLTLDGYLAAQGINERIAFVKLDAEGDEHRVLAGARRFFAEQSPVVMFEFKHGALVNAGLIAEFQALEFDIFRWSAELELLMPFDVAVDETAFALNLVAVRAPTQQTLAARGLLVTPQALAAVQMPVLSLDSLGSLCASPALMRVRVPSLESLRAEIAAAAGDDYARNLCAVAAAHLQPDLQPAARLALLRSVRDEALVQVAQGLRLGLPAWTLLVHCLYALGQQQAAIETAARTLAQWPSDDGLTVPCMPPLRANLQRARTTPVGSWLGQVLGEFVGLHCSFSSYFVPPDPSRWAALLQHPDHGAEVERRHLLALVLSDRIASDEHLGRYKHLVPAGRGANGPLWDGLVQSMRLLGAPAATPDRRVGPRPSDVLAALPVKAVQVVDVGASPLTHTIEPYAPLVAAGRACVTGFEPDPAGLAELVRRSPSDNTHRYLPHVVGDGSVAVLHEMHWGPTSSLLPPARLMLDRYHKLGEAVQEKARHVLPTMRLDDVIASGGMDMLKIDVQGAEGMVFDGAPQRLDECLVVWTEVEFAALYERQPLFGDIDAHLRGHGLQFLCFDDLTQRSLASWPDARVRQPQRQQQLWADAIYVPNPQRLATLSADAAARLALIAHHVLQAFDLCHVALQRYDDLSGCDFASRYLVANRLTG